MQLLYLENVCQLFDAFLFLTPATGIPHDLDQPEQCDTFVAESSSAVVRNYTMQCLATQAVKPVKVCSHGLITNLSSHLHFLFFFCLDNSLTALMVH